MRHQRPSGTHERLGRSSCQVATIDMKGNYNMRFSQSPTDAALCTFPSCATLSSTRAAEEPAAALSRPRGRRGSGLARILKNRIWRGIAAAAASVVGVTLSPASMAGPYALVAEYVPAATAGKDAKSFEIIVDDDDVIPQHTLTHELGKVSIRLKDDDVSKSALANLRNFVVLVNPRVDQPGSAPDPDGGEIFRLDALSAEAKAGKMVVGGSTLGADQFVHRVQIRTRSKFSPTYLCAQELDLRKAKGKEEKDWANKISPLLKPAKSAAPPAGGTPGPAKGGGGANAPNSNGQGAKSVDLGKADPTQLEALSLFSKRGLTDGDGNAILYSFCSDIADQVDWEQVSKKGPSSRPAADDTRSDAERARARHKHELSEKLRDWFASPQGGGTAVQVAADRPGQSENIFVSAQHQFTIAKHIRAQISFHERELETATPLGRHVEQDSAILLRCTGDHATCHDLVGKHVAVIVDGTDTKGNAVKKTVELESDGDGWRLKLSLRDFLYKDISLTTIYRLKDKELELRRDVVGIENFGLVTSFPVVSELVSLASASRQNPINPKDLEFKSTIPLSWAFNIDAQDGKHLAITLPWMIGYNPRIMPRLADIFRVFPHASIVLPVSSDASGAASRTTPGNGTSTGNASTGNAQLAFGVGVSLVNTFSIAWGMTVDTGANYALLGISVPDLVSLMK